MTGHPVRLIAIGFGVLAIGAALPYMMVLNLLESTLFLCLLSVFAQVGGLIMGFLGITHHGQYGRRSK